MVSSSRSLLTTVIFISFGAGRLAEPMSGPCNPLDSKSSSCFRDSLRPASASLMKQYDSGTSQSLANATMVVILAVGVILSWPS